MGKDARHDYIAKIFRDMYFGVVTSVNTHIVSYAQMNGSKKTQKFHPSSGQPDLMVYYASNAAFVEIKNGDKSFSWNAWPDNEIEWAQRAWDNYSTETFIGLVMGKGRADSHRRDNVFPTKIYLVPFRVALQTYHAFREVGVWSMPYEDDMKNTSLATRKMSAQSLFAEYEIHYERGEGWTIPNHNPFLETMRDWTKQHLSL